MQINAADVGNAVCLLRQRILYFLICHRQPIRAELNDPCKGSRISVPRREVCRRQFSYGEQADP